MWEAIQKKYAKQKNLFDARLSVNVQGFLLNSDKVLATSDISLVNF